MARANIPFEAVRDITKRLACDAEAAVDQDTVLTAEEAESSECPEVVAEVRSKAVGGRILLVGFTVTAAYTSENQQKHPQNPVQAEGLVIFHFRVLACIHPRPL